ncbi:hypothetical protein ACIRL2_30565 [Embleya sp. NPDC127516]|uniref:hypothetical protein n=1 Tax=Embleya sp. NPDC127516 TaxID=3363990 RepID=UPI00381B1DCB
MRQRQGERPGADAHDHAGRDGRERPQHRPTRPLSPAPATPGRLTPATALAFQGSIGNAAVTRMLRADPASPPPLPIQRMDGGNGGAGQPPQQPPAAQQPTPEQVKAAITALVDNPPMVNYGARRQGRAHGEFWMRFARSKQGEEAEETLSETSALLFDSMKGAQEQARDEDPDNAAEDTNNREVQGMLINDRLVFASNYNSSIDTLVERGTQQAGADPTLQELLEIEQSDEGRTRGLRGHEAENLRAKLSSFRRKNEAILTEQRGAGEQGRGPDATAMALRAKTDSPVIVVDIEDPDLHTMLTDRDHEGRVFLLRFAALDPRTITRGRHQGQQTQEGSVHAEQKLLLALRHAGIHPRRDVRGPIAIMGKYRPCMGCAAALMYYRERMGYAGLSFDENYGHYFQGSVDSLYTHQRHVMDRNYYDYIRQMVQTDITSTPAMANEAAPQGAQFRRGGPTLRVPGRYASRQADVTPPTSDAELDDDGMYTRVQRPLADTWTLDTAPAGIGQGSATHTIPRRKYERLTDDQARELDGLWNGTKGAPPTDESRRRAIELADEYNTRDRMTLEYLAGVVGLHHDRFGGYIARYRSEGHWKHVPSRSGKVESVPKNRKKGAPEKQFTKGGDLDEAGKDVIKGVIRSLPRNSWCADWERIHRGGAGGELNPTQAPDDLLRTLARLRRDQAYNVPSMSKYLHTGDKGDNLRKAISRKGDKLLAAHEASTKPVKTEDVDMDPPPSGRPAKSSSRPRGGQSQRPPTRPGPSSHGGRAGSSMAESSATGAGRARPVPEVPGYTLRLDARSGQPYYLDEDSGFHYAFIDGRMVRLYDDDDIEMSDAGR